MTHQIIERVLMPQQLELLLSLLPLPFHVKHMCDSMLGYEPLKNIGYIGDACMLGSPKYLSLQIFYGAGPESCLMLQ